MRLIVPAALHRFASQAKLRNQHGDRNAANAVGSAHMPTRRLGKTGYVVGEMGYGTWGLAGSWWRGIDVTDTERALAHGVERGIDFIDTALVYGEGACEQIVGRVVRAARATERVVVATKVPPLNMKWPGDGAVSLRKVYPAQHLQACVESSLRNSKLEVLPIEQLHVWHDAWLADSSWPEVRGTMERMVREGKVLHWGISVNDHAPDDALAILDEPIIETLQVIYNLFDRSPEKALLAKAASTDIGVIVRCPLDEGALGGEVGAAPRFAPNDWRLRYFRDERGAELAVHIAALTEFLSEMPLAANSSAAARAVAERARLAKRPDRVEIEARTIAELALRFCLARSEVSVVIPGMRSDAHVDANLAVSDGRALSPALLERLADHAWIKNWYGA